MANNRLNESLGFLGALLLDRNAQHLLSDQPSYEEFQGHLNDLVNDLAFDRVANTLLENAEHNFHHGDLVDVEPFVRDVMALVGRSHPAYGKAAMIRGYARFQMGESEAGVEYLKEAISSFAENNLISQLEDMQRNLSKRIAVETPYQADYLQLLHLCQSTLDMLHTQSTQDEH